MSPIHIKGIMPISDLIHKHAICNAIYIFLVEALPLITINKAIFQGEFRMPS